MKKLKTVTLFFISCLLSNISYLYAQNVGVDIVSPVEKLDIAGAIRITTATNANDGTIQYSGGDFLGRKAGAWVSLTSIGGITSLNGLTGTTQTFAIGSSGTAPAFSSAGTTHTLNIPFAATSGVTGGILSNTQYTTLLNGILPAGTSGQTLRHNGTNWIANSLLYNDGTNVGIGTTAPGAKLEVRNGNFLLSNSGTAGTLEFQGTSTGKTTIKAGAQGATAIPWVLPVSQGPATSLLTNDGAGNLTWGTLNALGASTYQVSQATNNSTIQIITSLTDVDVDGMFIIVIPGTYMVWFSSDVLNGNNANTCTVSIYVNGLINAISERNFSGLVKKNMVSSMAVVTVTSGAPVEIRVKAKVDASNATFYNRSLMGLKIL